jgi:hypothetical protein
MSKQKDEKDVSQVQLVGSVDDQGHVVSAEEDLSKNEKESSILSSILDSLNSFSSLEKSQKEKGQKESFVNLAFDLDITGQNQGEVSGVGVYRAKANLLPNEVIKKITGPGGDDLVCQIITARTNHMSLIARPRENRFDVGYDLVPKDKSRLPKDPAAMEELMKRVEKVKEFIWTCGSKIEGEHEQVSFSQYAKMSIRDGLRFGSYATSLINDDQGKMVAFRAADAGTIYRTVEYKKLGKNENIRSQALAQLKKLHQLIGKEFDESKYKGDLYPYAQVINGRPVQVFTENEMVVHNLYPVTDVEFAGYPLTPIDQAIHAITTHINITMHNKLYFQHGRAARGMLIIKARSQNQRELAMIKQQFQQTINSVKNSHRMPVFSVGPEDNITWTPIDNSGRDMEFSFLSDNNARVILGAFQMSPDELPGYGHLSRGSNSQALSESNNEFKLTAARDVGLRPLISNFQDFFNRNILPRIDEEVADLFSLAFMGLDKEDPNKESARLSQDLNLWMSINEVFDTVEKPRIPKEVGGDIILNPQFWAQVEKYLTFGEILENFFGKKGASKDPRFDFYQNPFYLQIKQLEQMEVQSRLQMMLSSMQPQQMLGSEGSPVQKSESEFVFSPEAEIELNQLKERLRGKK